MERLKTFLIYALLIIGFFILSEFLINVGLNSTYKPIERKDEISQITIYQAEATLVNGRIRGVVTNSQPDELNNKFIKIDFYSERDVFLGKKYVALEDIQPNETKSFEVFFKLEDVEYYSMSIVDEREEGEIELIPEEFTKPEIILLTIFTMLILW